MLTQFSRRMKCLILLEWQKVKDFKAPLKDSVQRNYQEKHIEVLEELVVLVLGIQPELDLKFQELVN